MSSENTAITTSDSTTKKISTVKVEDIASSLFKLTGENSFLRDAIRKSIETRMYSQKVFRGVHRQYGYVNPEEQAIRYMVAKLISPYYKKNVVAGQKTKFHLRKVPNERTLRKYTIIGSNFLVPFKKVLGLFIYITISREFNKSSGDINTIYTLTFIGRKHRDISNAFENKYLKILLNISNNVEELSVVDHMQNGYCLQRFAQYRSLNSVFIDHEKKNKIVSSVRRFRHPKTKELYREIQEPYHLNILLHGTPGTGKNSLIYALASEFNLNIERVSTSFFSTSSVSGPSGSLIAEMNLVCHSIVVIDEIDLIIKNRELESLSNTDKANLSMVLQYMDEVADGNIVICCTNHKDRLDPAFLRKGRINLDVELTDWDRSLLEEALEYHHITIDKLNGVLDEPVDIDDPDLTVNPSTMMEAIRICRLERNGIMENT